MSDLRKGKITVLDGGIGQELVKRYGKTPTAMWSTIVLLEKPEMLSDLHEDYFKMGATVGTTNSYAVHRDRIAGTEAEGKYEDLLKASATAVRDVCPKGSKVAGSIGPLVGSYRIDKVNSHETAVALYAEKAAQLEALVDILLIETVASLKQARAVLEGVQKTNTSKDVWIGFTVDDNDGTMLRSGESLASAIDIAEKAGVDAVLINCSVPEVMPTALSLIRSKTKLPFGAYANGFTHIHHDFVHNDKPTVDLLQARTDLSPEVYAKHVRRWVELGATIVGGCCETGPPHIAAVVRLLEKEGYEIAGRGSSKSPVK